MASSKALRTPADDDSSSIQKAAAIRNSNKSFRGRQEIFGEILKDIDKRCIHLFSTATGVFVKFSCIAFPIMIHKESKVFADIVNLYSMTSGERIFELVTEQLLLHARRYGKNVPLYRFSHYSVETNTLYVSNRGQQVFKITPTSIAVVPNGTDGILFFEPDLLSSSPVCFVDDPENETLFREVILDSLNFTEEANGISKINQGRIFEASLLSLYFQELMPTRPILVLSGEKGSGKSSALRRLGRLCYSPSFDVRLLPDNPSEFDVSVTNESFVVFDNVDTHCHWLEDKLAGSATGANIVRRKLFTTNEQQVFPVHARIALTARIPKFRREDVSERLIILKVERFLSFRPEYELNQEFERERDKVFSGLLFTLQGVLNALEETKDYHYQGSVRLADFASFLMRIGVGRGEETEYEEALSSLIAEQQVFSFEENKLFCILQEWSESIEGTKGPLSTAELFHKLKDYAMTKKQDFAFVAKNPISLGHQLAALSRLNECPLFISSRTAGGRRKEWTIMERIESSA